MFQWHSCTRRVRRGLTVYRAARAEISEFHPAWPEVCLQTCYSYRSLNYFYSSPNKSRSVYDLP
jgi:hypothetical protein